MEKILCMITYMFILFNCQMLFGEGRQIRSLSEVVTKYVKSPSHISIRKLSSQKHKSDHKEIPPKKITPQQPSADLFQTEINEKNFPSLKTHSSPRSSHEANSVRENKVESNVDSNCVGVKCTDDFRPTAPGHSPGAGHSFVTSTDKTSSNQPAKYSTIWNSLAAVEDDFKHTSQGRSPGAGHAEVDRRDPKLTTVEVQKSFPSTSAPRSVFSESARVSTKEFRTTSSGAGRHIPGAGHFFVTSTDKTSPDQPAKYSTIWNSLAAVEDDFKPNSQGRSPGAGHAEVNRRNPTLTTVEVQKSFPSTSAPRESALVSTNEFQTTSSGADHLHTKQIGVQGTEDCLSEKCTGDFRPTAPGHSPGGGHSLTNDSVSFTSQQGKQPNVANTHEEGTDDFRPTNPGHQSPGGGHAALDKAEPNS